MGTILSLLIILSFGCIFYFWLKKHNKKLVIASIISTVVFTGLMTLTPEYKHEVAKEEQKQKVTNNKVKSKSDNKKSTNNKAKVKSSNKESRQKNDEQSKKSFKSNKQNDEKTITSKSTLLSNAKKLKYGMSLTDVKKIMKVKPTTVENDDGFINLSYGNDIVLLGFDEHKKLTAAASGAPQIAKQGEKAAQQKKKERTDQESFLKSSAQYFGTKTFESIQNNPGAFKITEDGKLLYVLWKPDKNSPILLRVDNTLTNITNVYIYNKHGDDPKGRHLYTGRTIVQKKRNIIY